MKNLFNQVAGRMGVPSGDTGDPTSLGQLLLGMIGSEQGALAGLTKLFHDQGLGDVVDSWVGSGVKRPISAEQVRQVLGEERLAALGKGAGLAPENVATGLAALLPRAVSSLVSGGHSSEAGSVPRMQTPLAKKPR